MNIMTTEEISTATKTALSDPIFSNLISEKYRELFFYSLGVRFKDCESAYEPVDLKLRGNTLLMELAGQINTRMDFLEKGPFASFTFVDVLSLLLFVIV